MAKSPDEIRSNYLERVAEILETYVQDKGEYPKNIEDLVPEYINEKALNQKEFYYRKNWEGYEMGIKLSNGEVYEFKK